MSQVVFSPRIPHTQDITREGAKYQHHKTAKKSFDSLKLGDGNQAEVSKIPKKEECQSRVLIDTVRSADQ